MEAIHSLIHSLKKNEVRIARTALTCFSSRKDNNTKSLRLFDYLLKHKSQIPSNQECCKYIYNIPDDKRFKMLKSRLKGKLLDSLAVDVNIDHQELVDVVDKNAIKVRKKFLQMLQLYFSKGNHAIVENLLSEIIDLAKKFESYAPLIEALKFQKYSKGFCKGEKDFDRINEQIAFYEYCNLAVNRANDAYYRLILRTDFFAKNDTAYMQQYLQESIQELKKDYDYTQSAIVGYFLKFLEMAYFENKRDYMAGLKTGEELLLLIKHNKSTSRKTRIGIVYMNLSQFNIYLSQYKEAITSARNAIKFFLPQSFSYFSSKEQEFYALFYDNQIKEAEIVAKELVNKAPKEQGDFRLAKYRFYDANIQFKNGNYKAVLKELSQNFEISKDKIGWDTSIRILTTMSLIELQRFDEASARINSLRKHIERNIGKEDQGREHIVLKILLTLEKYGFVYNEITEKVEKYIDILENSTNNSYAWVPLGSELIPFHVWFKGKFSGKINVS